MMMPRRDADGDDDAMLHVNRSSPRIISYFYAYIPF